MRRPQYLARFCLLTAIAAGLGACGGDNDYDGFDSSIDASDPDAFLRFFNQQPDLGGGDYVLVAATSGAGAAGDFSVTIERNDGTTTQLVEDSWTSSGGLDADPTCASGNVCTAVSIDDASGATFTLSTDPAIDGVLYLVDNRGVAELVAEANDNGAGVDETLEFSDGEIDETAFTTAYYDAIDPGDARDTAQKFWSLHGFDTPGTDVHVIFRDSKDLGYGRDMYMRSYANPDCPGQVIAFFVRNFSVQIVDGFAYGPVNLEAAITEDLDHHVGTNAIEFSTGLTSAGDTACSPEPMARFYTYEPDYSAAGAPHLRRDRVDLDARGDKAMPQPCISCHGGILRPLDRFGRFVAIHANDPEAQIGDTKARMQAFEVDTFEFSDAAPYRRSDQEEGLRQMNAAIFCTYPGSAGHPGCASHGGGIAAQTDNGEWSGDFGRDMMLGWYDNALETAGSSFDDSYVPDGWKPSVGGPPVGADALFTKVVGPNCFVCHGKRGVELGVGSVNGTNTDPTDGKDIDFGSWDKFISHADEIERLVYEEGRMPLGLLNFNNFWDDSEKAELLASFIQPHVTDSAGFSARRTRSNGDIIEPGERVVARAGPDRVTQPSAAITLNANASLFAGSYRWQVTNSPTGSTPALSHPNSLRTEFSGDVAGNYTIQLTATSADGSSSRSDTLTVAVDAGLATAPRDLAFYGDIDARLNTCAGVCHDGTIAGIPVWWVPDAQQPLAGVANGVPASVADPPGLGFYEQVMTRVNFDYIEDSLILKKPSGNHHYGDQRNGFNTSLPVGAAGRADYDMFVNWIAEGAVCGGTTVQCVR